LTIGSAVGGGGAAAVEYPLDKKMNKAIWFIARFVLGVVVTFHCGWWCSTVMGRKR